MKEGLGILFLVLFGIPFAVLLFVMCMTYPLVGIPAAIITGFIAVAQFNS